MKCVFTECDNEATRLFSFGSSKGGLPICEECLQLYLKHDIARTEVKK